MAGLEGKTELTSPDQVSDNPKAREKNRIEREGEAILAKW